MQFGIWNVSLCVCLKGEVGPQVATEEVATIPGLDTQPFPFSYVMSELHPPETHLFTSGSVLSYRAGLSGGNNPAKLGKADVFPVNAIPADITLVQSRSVPQSLSGSPGTHSWRGLHSPPKSSL